MVAYTNCFHSIRTEQKHKSHENVYKNHDYYHVKMPEEIKRISNYNLKSIKIPFTIYADTESLLEKIQTCDNKPEKSITLKLKKYYLPVRQFCIVHLTVENVNTITKEVIFL